MAGCVAWASPFAHLLRSGAYTARKRSSLPLPQGRPAAGLGDQRVRGYVISSPRQLRRAPVGVGEALPRPCGGAVMLASEICASLGELGDRVATAAGRHLIPDRLHGSRQLPKEVVLALDDDASRMPLPGCRNTRINGQGLRGRLRSHGVRKVVAPSTAVFPAPGPPVSTTSRHAWPGSRHSHVICGLPTQLMCPLPTDASTTRPLLPHGLQPHAGSASAHTPWGLPARRLARSAALVPARLSLIRGLLEEPHGALQESAWKLKNCPDKEARP
jgi:hypothetical protein